MLVIHVCQRSRKELSLSATLCLDGKNRSVCRQGLCHQQFQAHAGGLGKCPWWVGRTTVPYLLNCARVLLDEESEADGGLKSLKIVV